MKPEWYDINNIPFSDMWPDDILWFPSMLKGQKFYGYFTFEGMDNITDYTLKNIEILDSVKIPKVAKLTTEANGGIKE